MLATRCVHQLVVWRLLAWKPLAGFGCGFFEVVSAQLMMDQQLDAVSRTTACTTWPILMEIVVWIAVPGDSELQEYLKRRGA